MALTDESGNGMVMPVAPMYGGNNGGFGGFGNDWGWIILLLLFAGGGWGNGFGGFGGTGELYPWMNQSNQINSGFRDQMLQSFYGRADRDLRVMRLFIRKPELCPFLIGHHEETGTYPYP